MNATCAIRGHDWFWRFALRLRMCKRCLALDVPCAGPAPQAAPLRHDHPLDAGGPVLSVPRGSSRLAGVERVALATTHGPMGAR